MKGNETEEIYVKITKPKNGIYIMDREILPFDFPIILGRITVEVTASPAYKIENVSFYIDDELKFTDYSTPYQWTWNEFAFGNYELKVVAYDENNASDEMNILIFNI